MARLLRFLHITLSKRVTIMVMPSHQAKVIQVAIPLYTILAVLTVAGSLFGTSLFIIGRHVNYYHMVSENRSLQDQLDQYANDMLNVKKAGDQVASLESSLRQLLGMKTKENIVKLSGIGGPLGREAIPRTAGAHAKRVIREADQLGKDFDEIEQHIGELHTLYRATPAGNPLQGGWVTSPFGRRVGAHSRDGHSTGEEFHVGMDIGGLLTQPVLATADGVVVFSGRQGSYGNLVVIQHGFGYTTLYGHNQKNLVQDGQAVKRGNRIALLGQTGNATGPHVHYEVRRFDKPVNPESYLKEDLTHGISQK